MPEVPGEVRDGSGSEPVGQARADVGDFPVDVCISHPEGAGRLKLHFRSSKPLVVTLIAWTGQGRTDTWLTWGATPPDVRERVEYALARASVRYATPPAASTAPRSARGTLVLAALAALACFAGLLVLLSQRLGRVVEGVNKAEEEQRARDEQNRGMMGRSSAAARDRTFRELEDADPGVRLQAVALAGQLYSADPRAVPALVKRVKDDDRRVRVAAIIVLGKTRTKSEEAAQALRGCLADDDEDVRKAAREALDKMR